MVLTVTVTKQSVTQRMPKMWAVTLTLVLDDNAGPGFTRSFSQNYKLGKSLSDLAAAFGKDMQAAIEQYKAERTYFDHAQLDGVVTAVQSGLEV